jgi:hypothetical protein
LKSIDHPKLHLQASMRRTYSTISPTSPSADGDCKQADEEGVEDALSYDPLHTVVLHYVSCNVTPTTSTSDKTPRAYERRTFGKLTVPLGVGLEPSISWCAADDTLSVANTAQSPTPTGQHNSSSKVDSIPSWASRTSECLSRVWRSLRSWGFAQEDDSNTPSQHDFAAPNFPSAAKLAPSPGFTTNEHDCLPTAGSTPSKIGWISDALSRAWMSLNVWDLE